MANDDDTDDTKIWSDRFDRLARGETMEPWELAVVLEYESEVGADDRVQAEMLRQAAARLRELAPAKVAAPSPQATTDRPPDVAERCTFRGVRATLAGAGLFLSEIADVVRRHDVRAWSAGAVHIGVDGKCTFHGHEVQFGEEREAADLVQRCRGCIHPPHLGDCTHRSGGTAYACGCTAQTPPSCDLCGGTGQLWSRLAMRWVNCLPCACARAGAS